MAALNVWAFCLYTKYNMHSFISCMFMHVIVHTGTHTHVHIRVNPLNDINTVEKEMQYSLRA